MNEQTGNSVGDSTNGLERAVTLVSLKESLDIWQNTELKEELTEALIAALPVTIKGDQVVRVDAAAIQLLAGFFMAMEKANVECQLDDMSHSLQQAITWCGLTPYFMQAS